MLCIIHSITLAYTAKITILEAEGRNCVTKPPTTTPTTVPTQPLTPMPEPIPSQPPITPTPPKRLKSGMSSMIV